MPVIHTAGYARTAPLPFPFSGELPMNRRLLVVFVVLLALGLTGPSAPAGAQESYTIDILSSEYYPELRDS
jgi:hypothetical protein